MTVPRKVPSSVGLVGVVTFVLLVGVLGGYGTVRGASLHADQASTSLTVEVSSALSFTLSSNEVTPGDDVSVSIVQTSTTVHTFTLLNATDFQFNWSSSSSDSLAHIDAFLAAHPPLLNVSIPDTVGTLPTVHFTAPPFGLYEYLCLEPGHFAAGMWGILGSGEPGSGGAAPDTGPGAPVFIISGSIATLVVVAIVLGFVIGRRKGAVHEMPPERLGYPEPSPPTPPK